MIALKPKKMIPAPIAARPVSPPASMQTVQRAVMESLNIRLITFPAIFKVLMVFAKLCPFISVPPEIVEFKGFMGAFCFYMDNINMAKVPKDGLGRKTFFPDRVSAE